MNCHFCGRDVIEADGLQRQNGPGKPAIWACHDHLDRIKCSISDCSRTTSRDRAGSEWLCPEHWRRHCPPRSRLRRTYHAHHRRAKRYGWTEDTRKAFWRFWDALVARAQREHDAASVDIAEINRIMGW